MGHIGCVFPSVLPVQGEDCLKDQLVNVTSQANKLQLLLRAPKCINILTLKRKTFNLVVSPALMIYNQCFLKHTKKSEYGIYVQF